MHMNYFRTIALSIAGLVGCGDDICFSRNDSTVALNRPADGYIASWDELLVEPSEKVMTDAVIDFINETHARTSERLPTEVTVTKVPSDCVLESHGYVRPPDPDIFVKYPIHFDLRRLVNHEVGHLQPHGRGNEIISTINLLEQELAGYVCTIDAHSVIGYAHSFSNLLSDLPSVLTEDAHLVDREFPFIYLRMCQGVSFESMRAEVGRLIQMQELDLAVARSLAEFRVLFPLRRFGNNAAAREAEILLHIKSFMANEFYSRYGAEKMQEYLRAESFFPYQRSQQVLTYGLDEMLCSNVERHTEKAQPCHDCLINGAHTQEPFTARFCCIEPQVGEEHMRKYMVEALGIRYAPAENEMLDAEGFRWQRIDNVTVSTRTEINPPEVCR